MDLVGGIEIAFHRAFEIVTNVRRSIVRLSLSFTDCSLSLYVEHAPVRIQHRFLHHL